MLVGAAQILWLEVPDHAAVDLSVRLVQADRRAARYAGLVNAVLRRLARDGKRLGDTDRPTLDTPEWLMARWSKNYGAADRARDRRRQRPRAGARSDGQARSGALGTGAGRARAARPARCARWCTGRSSQLPGYAEGAWWVQDAAAALPARLLGEVGGRTVADLCAAPGGKTAQLAAAGAHVVAVDRSPARLERLRQNLARLALEAECVAADVTQWSAGPFDAVLLDAPCSATGTIRRHPDIPWLKREADIAALAALQRRLIARAADLTRSGGTLVYCTCSLEPEEGIEVVRSLLDARPDLRRQPIAASEVARLRPLDHRRRRPADAALPPARPQFALVRARRLLRRPPAKGVKDLSALVGRRAPLRYLPAGLRKPALSGFANNGIPQPGSGSRVNPIRPVSTSHRGRPGAIRKRADLRGGEPGSRWRAFRSRNEPDCPCSWHAASLAG